MHSALRSETANLPSEGSKVPDGMRRVYELSNASNFVQRYADTLPD